MFLSVPSLGPRSLHKVSGPLGVNKSKFAQLKKGLAKHFLVSLSELPANLGPKKFRWQRLSVTLALLALILSSSIQSLTSVFENRHGAKSCFFLEPWKNLEPKKLEAEKKRKRKKSAKSCLAQQLVQLPNGTGFLLGILAESWKPKTPTGINKTRKAGSAPKVFRACKHSWHCRMFICKSLWEPWC